MKRLLEKLLKTGQPADSSTADSAISIPLLQNLIEHFPIGLAIYDQTGRILYANKTYMNDSGVEGTLVGKTDQQVFRLAGHDTSVLAKREKYFDQVLSTGKVVGFAEAIKMNETERESYYRRYYLPVTGSKSESGNNYVCFFGINTTTIVRSQKELKYLAYHDKLTGLRNRDAFNELLEQIILESSRENNSQTHAVLFCDLDNFKLVNDTVGHDVGDLVLQECARRLRKTLRKSDYIFRLAGDEFTVILKNLKTGHGPGQVAQKIVEALSEPIKVQKHVVNCLSTSVGISIFPKDGKDKETLLKCADTAMYQAKTTGKNNYQFFNAEMTRQTVRRIEITTALRELVGGKKFDEQCELRYQPIVKFDERGRFKVAGVEALIRWRSPEIGDVSPGVFIPIAEETHLIHDIGFWAMRKSCQDIKQMYADTRQSFYLSVNLSAIQLSLPDIPSIVREIVDETGFSPRELQLELTETAYLDYEDELVQNILAIHNFGARLAIDDFGVGYASLAYLHKIPATTLKIDQSFIREVTRDPKSEAFIRAMLSLGRDLKKNIIAEGVETYEQMLLLRKLGCNGFQGYLFSKPLVAEDLRDLLMQESGPVSLDMAPQVTTFP